ncbi:RecX family transcriptional regulator [Candidatus Saccharibacteria bacterium]|nr:RecX family transcriptional regulator [Candidatus Saccharibacteria bacterium]
MVMEVMEIKKRPVRRPEGEEGLLGGDGGMMVVTDLRQQVKDKTRISIYVNGRFSFGLTLAQVADLGLRKGLQLDVEKIEELKGESEYGKMRAVAVMYCCSRERSIKELRDYMRRRVQKKELPDKFVDRILRELMEKEIVSDARFAKLWAESRKSRSGISKKKLDLELMRKGVDRNLIAKTLDEVFGEGGERDEKEELIKVLAKKGRKYMGDRRKLTEYLFRQGFRFDTIREVLDEQGIAHQSRF